MCVYIYIYTLYIYIYIYIHTYTCVIPCGSTWVEVGRGFAISCHIISYEFDFTHLWNLKLMFTNFTHVVYHMSYHTLCYIL